MLVLEEIKTRHFFKISKRGATHKLIYTWRLGMQTIERRRRAHTKTHWYSHIAIDAKLNANKSHISSTNPITHGLDDGLGVMCYPLKDNITNFPLFILELHILSMIIIQSKQVLSKRFMLKLRKMKNRHFDLFS